MPRGIRGSNPIPHLSPKQQYEFELLTEDPKFKECLNRLTGWRARRAAQGQAHPYLDRDDLRQVALIAAYEAFARYINTPMRGGDEFTERRRLCIRSMRWALMNEFKRAKRSGGGDNTIMSSLDFVGDNQASCTGKRAFTVGDDDSSDRVDALEMEVSALCGEPDPLTVLLLKERAGL